MAPERTRAGRAEPLVLPQAGCVAVHSARTRPAAGALTVLEGHGQKGGGSREGREIETGALVLVGISKHPCGVCMHPICRWED